MLKKVSDLTSADFSKGLSTISNIMALEKNQSPNMMNVIVEHDGSIRKRLGSTTMNSIVIAQSGGAGFSPDSANLLLTNVRAFWKFDESDGQRMDSISTHHLTENGGVGQAVGIKRYAANLVAANSQYLIFPNTATLATGNVDMSWSIWFMLSTTSPSIQRTLISKRDLESPIDSQTKLLLHMDGADGSTTFTDSSPSGHVFTASGNSQIDTAQSKFGGASGLFDGTGDEISAPDSENWFMGTSSMTIDLWLRFATTAGTQTFMGQRQDAGNFWALYWQAPNTLQLEVFDSGVRTINPSITWTPAADTWYHVALVRDGNDYKFFINGTQNGLTQNDDSSMPDFGVPLILGSFNSATYFNGWMDEVRISKGVARWSADFVAPTKAYGFTNEYEYWLFVNTDQIVTFRVSSNGLTHQTQVQASSFGAVTTGTWYNAVAWHDTAGRIGLSVNLSVNTASHTGGLRSGSAPFVIGAVSNGAANFFDGRADEAGVWGKVLTAQNRSDLYNAGVGNTYSLSFERDAWASFDFGATNLRWLTVAAGTGIYASSNLGVTWVNIASDRTATYQYFERSKNVLVSCSDAYDTPLQWTGSANTFMGMLNVSAPSTKFAINFQGFLILLNSRARKRGFFYEDENTQLTGDWADGFDIPSSADDEITAAFVLGTNMYVSTRYKIYRVTYVGGNPDWRYREVRSWGFVPRTPRKITLQDIGEVVIGLDWDRKIRLFDGADDKLVSQNVEHDNKMCDFALDKVSYALSGLTVSHAEVDTSDPTYRLAVAIGANSTNVTHQLNFNARNLAFYPFSNMPFTTMVMAESANRRFFMAFDRSGYCHLMDSGNLDGGHTPINDVFDSPLFYEKSPSEVSKSQRIDFYLSPSSSGTLYFLDRTDFSSDFKLREQYSIDTNGTPIQLKRSADIPSTQGVYQYRLTSSANAADPWTLNRTDYFLSGLGIGNPQ